MLFNADAINHTTGSPDNRCWGDMNWWQNLRLPYWSMYAAGDWEFLDSVFDYYLDRAPFGAERTRVYYNHSGWFFHETTSLFGGLGGLTGVKWSAWPHQNHTYWMDASPYTGKDFGGDAGPIEVSVMLLDAYDYTGDPKYVTTYLPIITLTVDFFRQHYLNRTSDGRIVIWPTQALESFWCSGWDTNNSRPPANCCVDDMPTVAGLTALMQRLERLPSRFSTAAQRSVWKSFHKQLPEVPVDDTQLLVARVVSTLLPGNGNPARQNPPSTPGGKLAWIGGKENSEVPELCKGDAFGFCTMFALSLTLSALPCRRRASVPPLYGRAAAHVRRGPLQGARELSPRSEFL